MRTLILIVLAAVMTIACQRSNPDLRKQAGIEKEKLADDIIRKVATELKKETNLRPCGTMGQMLNEIQKLGLGFYCYEPTDIVEGRKLLVKAVNKMLAAVNNEPRIEPYLIRYPFRPRNIEIEIFLRSPDGKDVAPGSLWIIKASDGFLYYEIDNPKTKRLTTIYKETYEQAIERIANPTLPLVPFESDTTINQEELAKLRKGISFIGDDRIIKHLDKSGCWTQ